MLPMKNAHSKIQICIMALIVSLQAVNGFAQQTSGKSTTTPQSETGDRDGQHDFDFEIGTWKTHLKRLVHPLTGSQQWATYDGTTVVRKVWAGRANLVELEVDGQTGHMELLSLRLYDPQAHQWSLNVASSKGGSLGVPTI